MYGWSYSLWIMQRSAFFIVIKSGIMEYGCHNSTMVLIIYGNSEIVSHLISIIWSVYGIWLDRVKLHFCFFFGKDLFSFLRAQHILSYLLILVPWTKLILTNLYEYIATKYPISLAHTYMEFFLFLKSDWNSWTYSTLAKGF